MTISTYSKIEEAIRDYYEMLDQLSSEEVDQFITSVLKPEGEPVKQESFPTPPFYCRTKTYSD